MEGGSRNSDSDIRRTESVFDLHNQRLHKARKSQKPYSYQPGDTGTTEDGRSAEWLTRLVEQGLATSQEAQSALGESAKVDKPDPAATPPQKGVWARLVQTVTSTGRSAP